MSNAIEGAPSLKMRCVERKVLSEPSDKCFYLKRRVIRSRLGMSQRECEHGGFGCWGASDNGARLLSEVLQEGEDRVWGSVAPGWCAAGRGALDRLLLEPVVGVQVDLG